MPNVEEAQIGHEHTESQYCKCLDCGSMGVGFYNDTQCGNCRSKNTCLLLPPCCVEAMLKIAFTAGWRAFEHGNLPTPYDGRFVIPAAFEEWYEKMSR